LNYRHREKEGTNVKKVDDIPKDSSSAAKVKGVAEKKMILGVLS